MNVIKFCVEFILALLILWLMAVFFILAGSVLLIFTPVIALWYFLDGDYEECLLQQD